MRCCMEGFQLLNFLFFKIVEIKFKNIFVYNFNSFSELYFFSCFDNIKSFSMIVRVLGFNFKISSVKAPLQAQFLLHFYY